LLRCRGRRRAARDAGLDKHVTPHSLRHAFITAALDAGVPPRDVQEAASHAEPRTTMRYDRGGQSLDRHATYIVATFVAGASRQPPGPTSNSSRSARLEMCVDKRRQSMPICAVWPVLLVGPRR
jgi:hypothetical protein